MKALYCSLCLLLTTYITHAQTYDDYLGGGHSIGITATSSDDNSTPLAAMDGTGLDADVQGASRFLAHSTIGVTMNDIEKLAYGDIKQWIDQQIALPATTYTDRTIEIIFDMYEQCVDNIGEDACRQQFVTSTTMWRSAWWDQALKNEDKLRQRVAMALSEILVISDRSDLEVYPHGLAYYYDILSRNAFGNYKDILTEVTLNPSMGHYLSHINNPRSIPLLNIRPDENYAREIMQLFSIGLYELQQNGARKVDMSTGLWIPTYDNDDIVGLAKVFTGLSGSKWEDDSNTDPVTFGRNFRRYSVLDPMAMYEDWHEPGEKTIIGDYTIPAGQSGMEDIEQAIEHLFNHENVGPFLGRQLIQRLVKSNPSADYIGRVSAVFADNGNGVRGDLAAVVKAILTDPEARECYWIGDEYSAMLRSPMLRYTQMMIGLEAKSESDWFWNSGATFQRFAGQHLLSSPTVFNFYSPDYVPNADFAYYELTGPEFQILNSSTSSNYVNWMLVATQENYITENFNVRFNWLNDFDVLPAYMSDRDSYRATLTNTKWRDLARTPTQMVDYLDILLTNGQLSEERKAQIVQSLQGNVFDTEDQANYALFLIMIDPDYVIMK